MINGDNSDSGFGNIPDPPMRECMADYFASL